MRSAHSTVVDQRMVGGRGGWRVGMKGSRVKLLLGVVGMGIAKAVESGEDGRWR